MPRNPAAQVLPFFFLNHRLEAGKLRSRIREMKAAGSDGFFIHAREGLVTPYLSKEWFAAVEACIDEARRQGMRAWLYDEMPYPSGVAGGEVVRRRPEFVEQSLRVERRNFPGGRRIEWKLGGGEILACYARRRSGRREVVDLREDVGPVADTWRKTYDVDSKLYYPTGPAEVFECPRSICVLPENVLAVTLPRGSWELVAIATRDGGDLLEPFGNYVDVSNPEATQLFLELTHEAYARRFGKHFGRTVPGIFCDEPKFRNPLPWGWGVAKAVGKISPALAFALAGETGEAANAERRKYRRTTAQAFLEHWTAPISRWCGRHKVSLTGHISPEEEWWYESRHVGSILANLRKFHLPGCDVIIPAAGDWKNAILNLTAGLAVSAAAQAGRPQALCEVFGACDFTLGLRTMKRMGDWLAVAGINVAVPHGFLYSMDGYRKLDAPPNFGPPAFAAADLAAWAGEFRSAAELLGPGVAPDVLAIRPIDYLRGLPDSEVKQGEQLLIRAANFATEMARRGLRLHWIDDDELGGVRISGGRFAFGRCRYRQLVYFGQFTDGPTAARLAALGRKGAVMEENVALGSLRGPLESDGDVHAARRRDGKWFVANVGKTPAMFTLSEDGWKGRERTFRSVDRKTTGRSVLLAKHQSRLRAGESCVVDLRRPEAAKNPSRTLFVLPDRWNVILPETNTTFLEWWTLNGKNTELRPAFDLQPGWSPVTGQTLFGPVPLQPQLAEPREWIYRTTFSVGGSIGAKLVCESGHMRGAWTARLNGRPLGKWRKEGDFLQTHPLVGLLRPGVNRVEFRFTLRSSTDGMIGAPRIEGDFLVGAGGRLMAKGKDGRMANAGTARSTLGLPCYSGPLRYWQRFEWAGTGGQAVRLRCAGITANGAAVRVNGVPSGSVRWAPDEVDVTRALRRGSNLVEIDWRGSPVTLTGRVDSTRLGGRVKLVEQG
jgi:hypothetical protein